MKQNRTSRLEIIQTALNYILAIPRGPMYHSYTFCSEQLISHSACMAVVEFTVPQTGCFSMTSNYSYHSTRLSQQAIRVSVTMKKKFSKRET